MNNEKKARIVPSAVVGIVLCVLFIPIILINLTLIVGSYIHPDELPGVFGVKPVVVLSGSMEPAIKTGDFILIRDTDPTSLQEGDVVCYLSSGTAVTHRIKSITAGEDGTLRFITQGDNNNAADQLSVAVDQVQGVWNGTRIGGLGNFILFMQTPIGMVLFIICPLLLFVLWDVWHRRRMDKAEADRTAALEAELAALKSGAEKVQEETASSSGKT